MRALIIDEPWISAILRGEKTWEMRKKPCHFREKIGLIRKGSGQVVGVADVADSLAPIATRAAYADAERFHRIPPDRQPSAFADGWTTPWVLKGGVALRVPVPYQHKSGAVVWVTLDPEVARKVEAQS